MAVRNLDRFVWFGYLINFALGMAALLSRAVFGRDAELWAVAASVVLTQVWAFILHRNRSTWHTALTMGIAGLLTGGAASMIFISALQPNPTSLFGVITFAVAGAFLTRLLVKELKLEGKAEIERQQWKERLDSMSDEDRIEEFNRLNTEIEGVLAQTSRSRRYVWPLAIAGLILTALGFWLRFFSHS